MKYFLQKKGYLTKDAPYYYRAEEEYLRNSVKVYCDNLIDSSITHGGKLIIHNDERIIAAVVTELKRRSFQEVYVVNRGSSFDTQISFIKPPPGITVYEVY